MLTRITLARLRSPYDVKIIRLHILISRRPSTAFDHGNVVTLGQAGGRQIDPQLTSRVSRVRTREVLACYFAAIHGGDDYAVGRIPLERREIKAQPHAVHTLDGYANPLPADAFAPGHAGRKHKREGCFRQPRFRALCQNIARNSRVNFLSCSFRLQAGGKAAPLEFGSCQFGAELPVVQSKPNNYEYRHCHQTGCCKTWDDAPPPEEFPQPLQERRTGDRAPFPAKCIGQLHEQARGLDLFAQLWRLQVARFKALSPLRREFAPEEVANQLLFNGANGFK